MEWISIKEKLPDIFRKVLVWIEPPNLLQGYFDTGLYKGKGEWYVVTNKHVTHHITYWMKPDVPKPYVPYSDRTVAFSLALKSKLKNMEIKFKSPEHLALFIDKFMHSEQGEVFEKFDIESHHLLLALEAFINIHGHE